MSRQALTFKDTITLVGSAYVSPENFKATTQFASNVVAADGGANICLQYGVKPKAVIGDLDSIEETSKAQIDEDSIHFVSSQDDTDFEKSLKRINAPLILGVGFLGDRVDHQMAVQTALVKHYNKKILLIGSHDIVFLTPPEFSVTLENDCRVSLYPMAECTVVSKGLKWKTEDIVFSPTKCNWYFELYH
jgi:thiamine pyrophosphokinase